MKKVRLSVKLTGGFVIVSLLILVVGFVGSNGISKALRIVKRLSLSQQLLQRENDHLKWAAKVSEFEGDENMTELDVEKDDHKCGFGKWYYSEDRKKAEAEMPGIGDLLRQLEEPHMKLHKSAQELENILRKEKGFHQEAIRYYQGETREHLKNVQRLLGDIRSRVDESAKAVEAVVARDRGVAFVGTIIGILVALALGVILSNSISKPIYQLITGLTDGAEQVASASAQVSSASQSLAEGASEQAAGLEETSSSMEEMASMTKQNADNANHANTLMMDTSRVVDEANRDMGELIQSMNEISTASEETAKIIKTIDEIAFQTNLLALNAAVEAARVGEAGAGFAVVADEVRNLAMRAAEAAKNTASMIEGTVKKVKNGSDIVSKTNEAFTKVATGAKKAGELVAEITAASQEQAQGLEQINKAVAEIDKVVQQNAASAEESASASEEMNAQAEQMKAFVGELVALVAGGKDGDRVVSGQGQLNIAVSRDQVPVVARERNSGDRKPRSALIKKGKEMAAGISKAREVKPNQVIPMEEGDFKEF